MFCYYFVRFSLRFSTHETQIAFYTINEQRNDKSIKNKSYTTTNTTTTNYDSITTAVTAVFIAKSSLKMELTRERWDELICFSIHKTHTHTYEKYSHAADSFSVQLHATSLTHAHTPSLHKHTHTHLTHAHWVFIFVCVFNWNFDFINWCLSNLLQARKGRKNWSKRWKGGESRR